MHSPEHVAVEEFYKHQETLLPHTSPYLGGTNLDIGCGNGLTSLVHHQKLGIAPTLCDVIDIRHELARSFPFYVIAGNTLPFPDHSFVSSYLQYVLHHLSSEKEVLRLLSEAARVSDTIIIVEEIQGEKTNLPRAKIFDQEVNEKIHPNVIMPVYRYYTEKEIRNFFQTLGRTMSLHHVVSRGSDENGFLETHVFVAQ